MKFVRLFILLVALFCFNHLFAQQPVPTDTSVEHRLAGNKTLNEQLNKIAATILPSLLDSDRTRIIVMDYSTDGKSISLLGSYIRRKIIEDITTHEGIEIVDQSLIIKDLVDDKIPVGKQPDSSELKKISKGFFSEAIISGSVVFNGTSAIITTSIYSEETNINGIVSTTLLTDDIRIASLTPSNDYSTELLSVQVEEDNRSLAERWTENFIEKLGKMKPFWIYFIVSLIAFIENIFPPFPSDAIVVAGGFFVGIGKVKFWILLLGSTTGSTLGFMLAYYIGVKCSTTKISQLKIKYVPVDALIKVGAWFAKYGYTLIIVNRFLAGTRAVVSFFAGLSGLPLLLTTTLSFVSALAWNALLIYGGTRLGKNWQQALTYIEKYSHIMLYVFIGAAIISVVVYLLRLNKKSEKETLNEESQS